MPLLSPQQRERRSRRPTGRRARLYVEKTRARVVAWIKARLIMLEEKQAKGAGAAKAIENAGVCSRLCVPSHTHVARCCASCLKKVVFVATAN
jgi:hypothetical protein